MTALDYRGEAPELLRIRLPFGEGAPATARDALGAFSDRLGDSADDARLLVSELATNAVRHGRELGDAAGGMALRVLAIGGGLRIEVISGSGDSPPKIVGGMLPTMPSGRGLRLVDKLATRWGFSWDRRATAVWFEQADDPADEMSSAALLADAHRALGRSTEEAEAVIGVLEALARLSASDRAEYWSVGNGPPRLAAAAQDHAGGRGTDASKADLADIVASAAGGNWPDERAGDAQLAAAPIRSGGSVVGVIAVRTERRGDAAVVGQILRPIATQLARYVTSEQVEETRLAVLSELAFLAEASRLLASSLDYDETLRQVARLLVPARADWCTINVIEDRAIRRVAAEHANPDVRGRLEVLLDRFPHDPDADTGVPLVIRTGEPLLFEEVSASLLEETANDPDYLAITQELRISSCIIVPLEARGRVVGTMSVVSTDHTRLRFGEADLAVMLDLGRRAGMAIDNAGLYTERAYLAAALQRLLLPESLPEIPGLELAARYVPARDTTDVGGDFYDVVGGPAGEWYFIVGDVQGKGPDAATLIGMARHTMRTSAMRGDTPGETLVTLNRALLAAPTDRTCTAACLRVVDRGDRLMVSVARAGHPPPLLLRPGRPWSAIEPRGMFLGIVDVDLEERQFELLPGEAIVLYSDGAFGRDVEEGAVYDRLAAAAGSAEDIAQALLAGGGEAGGWDDDVTALVLRMVPSS